MREAFRDRYIKEVLHSKAAATRVKAEGVFNAVENILQPKRLSQITAERLSYFQAELRRRGKAPATIKSTLAHLKSALRWAERVGLLAKAPRIDMPGQADKMKGRPITTEEFERMLDKVEAGLALAARDPKSRKKRTAQKPLTDKVKAAVQKREDARQRRLAAQYALEAPRWRRLLRGLWLSGLRLSEGLNLTWDVERTIEVDLSGRRPMLHIPAALNKNKKEQTIPITPDFAAMLQETPVTQRTGYVFDLPFRRRIDVGRRITAFGQAALVKVGSRTKPGADGEPVTIYKWASAHDLRRSFGERWAGRLMPAQLMELMRHKEISTTMRFYVGANAERTADAVWAAFEAVELRNGNASSNRGNQPSPEPKQPADVSRSEETI